MLNKQQLLAILMMPLLNLATKQGKGLEFSVLPTGLVLVRGMPQG